MPLQVVKEVAVGLVLDLVPLHQLHVLGVGGRDDDVAGGAVQVGQPFEQPRVLQGHRPDQLAVHLLDGGGADVGLAAEGGVLAQLLLGQLLGQLLVHDGDVRQIHGLDVVGELAHDWLGHLVFVGVDVEDDAGGDGDHDQKGPDRDQQPLGPLGELLVVAELHVDPETVFIPRKVHSAQLQNTPGAHVEGDDHRVKQGTALVEGV